MNAEHPELKVVSFRVRRRNEYTDTPSSAATPAAAPAAASSSSGPSTAVQPSGSPEDWQWTTPGLLPMERPLMCIAALFGAWVATTNGSRGSIDDSIG